MIRRRTITSYVWNSVSGNKMVILSNCIRNFFRKFELLGNSVQGENPAPENPQEIKSAGRKSKNLLIENISVFTVQDNIAYIPLPEGHETKPYTMLIQKKPGENDDVGFTCGFYDKSNMTATYSAPCLQAGNLVTGNGIVNSKIGVNHFVCFSPADSRFFDIYNVMYAEGKETTLDYEPYGYLLDVKVTGKNLLDMADIQNENGKIDSDFRKAKSINPFKVIKDRKYLLISKGTMIVDVRYSSIYFGENDLAYRQDSSRKLTTGTGYSCFIGTETRKILVAKETCTITKTMMHGTITEKDAYEVEELGLFEIINDNPNIDYAPYTEQFAKIVLNEPLRGVGEYKDVLTKDGVVRKIKRIVFDENTPFKEYNAPVQVKTTSFISGTAIKDATGETGIEVMSDRFKAKDRGFDRYDEECITLFGKNIFVRFNKDKNINTAEALTEWLKQNPLTVDYVLAEPVTEPLPESVQQQLQALRTENGVTHVFVDSGEVVAGINIEYKYKS
jgi:hypothetical protein